MIAALVILCLLLTFLVGSCVGFFVAAHAAGEMQRRENERD